MNSGLTIFAAVALAGATSVGIQLALQPDTPVGVAEPIAPGELSALQRELTSLRAEQAQIRASLERLESLGLASAPARVSSSDIEDAIARHFAAEADDTAPEEAAAPRPGAKPLADLSTEDLLDRLLAADLPAEERHELWQEVRAAGRIDEVLAAFEARAEANPNDPALQVDLGEAYLQKIQEVGNGPLAGVLAGKADLAFDAALALDPSHWDARFNKAIALSFWPPLFGKQNEAIAQFEILVDQQANVPAQSQHAQTHLLLGNMYQQIGETEKAVAAWQAGLALFPDDSDLLAQIALVTGQ